MGLAAPDSAAELGDAAAAPSSVLVSAGGIAFNLLFDPAATAAPAAFRAGIEQAATLLSQTISNQITVNINTDYSGTGGGANGGPGPSFFESYATVRSDLINDAIPGDTTFDALPNAASIQGQSQVWVSNAERKLFGLLGANDTTTDDGSAHFSTDIPSNNLVGVALHELSHALGRIAVGPTPDIFDLFRFTSPGTLLFTGGASSAPAYFSLDGGVTDLADYGQTSDPGDFLNTGVQGSNDPFNERYNANTDQYLTLVDKEQLDALGFGVPSIVAPSVTAVSSVSLREGQSISASSLIASVSDPNGDNITRDIYEDAGGGSGYFTVNGVPQADGVWIPATPSENVQYVGGSSPGSDTLVVGIYDATTNTNIYAGTSVVATTIYPRGAGGGGSGILFQNTDGQIAIWQMNGTTPIGGGAVNPNPGPAWQAIGTADFYGGGSSDILFQNANGQAAIWEMNGTNLIGGGTVSPNPGPSWNAIGTGDFNHDGHSDSLWQNVDGQAAIWEMNGTNLIGGGTVGLNPEGWQAIGTGDFFGGGDSDILFQNASSGQVAIWEMNGTNVIGGGTVNVDPGPAWHAIGTSGAGSPDILFQSTSGQTALWEMNGTNIIGGGLVSPNPGSAWKAIGLT